MNKLFLRISLILCSLSTYLNGYPPLPHDNVCFPHPENIEQTTFTDVAVGCVFRNEASWLEEWIVYHQCIGVDHFYLYNNCSTDNYEEILLPYIRKGVVELFDFPKKDLAKQNNEWLAIIDTDEFINPVSTDNLKDFLKTVENVHSVYAKWQIFGTSNIETIEPGQLMIEQLILRAPDGHPNSERFGKSIYHATDIISIKNAHFGKPVKGKRPCKARIENLKINHYYYRTEKFLREVKIPRQKIWKGNPFKGPKAILDFLICSLISVKRLRC